MTTYEFINGQGFHFSHNLEKETLKSNDELQLFLKKFCTSYKITDLDEEEEFTVERRTVTCPEEAASLDRMYGDKNNEAA